MTAAAAPAVAVIDVGSNSIKVLVAARGPGGALAPRLSRTVETRISAGLSRSEPQLSEAGMANGLAAIQELLAAAAPYSPVRARIVATSAVRDARNGAEFAERVRRATGFTLEILSGEAEANGIGRGLTSDPALAHLRNFYVFDLGGGSLECLAFAERRVQQAVSLQLGCVRLTEKFVTDPAAALPAEARKRIGAHSRLVLAESGFRFDLPAAGAVVTGGAASTVRVLQAAATGRTLAETPALVSLPLLRAQLEQLAPLTLAQRRAVPGMPAARADILPAALATLIAVAETGGLSAFHQSFHNLRFGLAAELLEAVNA